MTGDVLAVGLGALCGLTILALAALADRAWRRHHHWSYRR